MSYIGLGIFDGAPDDVFVEVSQLPNRKFYLVKDLPEIDPSLQDVYYSPALRKNQGSTKEDVWGTKVLWADIDRPAAPQATLPPSAIVYSGGGYHYYWLLKEFVNDSEKIESANKALMEDLDADSCWNVNRLLRVPGTINSKYGKLATLTQKYPYVYQLEDFGVLAKLDSKSRHKIRTGDRRGYKSRSERDWVILEALLACGASERLIYHLFATSYCGDKFRDPEVNGKEYLQHTLEQVKSKSVQFKIAKRQLGELREGDDGYYAERARGTVRLSTFVFHPTLLLEHEKTTDDPRGEDALCGDVYASGHIWKDITLPRSAFNDRKALDKYLRVSAWVWLGKDDDVRALLPYLLRQLQEIGLPKSKSTTVLGRHGPFFAVHGHTFSQSEIFVGKDAPLIYLEMGRESPTVVYNPPAPQPNLGDLFKVNELGVIWPIVGWFMATPYKPLFEINNVRFPILNLYGTRGSGKTSLLRTMQRLLGYKSPTSYDCNTTGFVALSLLGSSNACPVAFSEFRVSSQGAERFLRFVLLAYDTGHNPRGRADQTTVDYPLSAPFSVDGEDIINDSAAKERIIAVPLHPESIAEGSAAFAAYKRLAAEPLENFSTAYVQFCLGQDIGILLARARSLVAEQFSETLPDRVRNNFTVVTAGIISFCTFVGIDIPDLACLNISLGAVFSDRLGRTPTLADEFAEFVTNSVSQHHAQFLYLVDENNVLWFQMSTAFDFWKRMRRSSGLSSLERDAVTTQLRERDITKGGKGQYIVPAKIVRNAWCYGIDLQMAFDSGLDIPSKIDTKTLVVPF